MALSAASNTTEGSPRDVKPNIAQPSLLDGTERDEEFNFQDGNIYLKVENRVFFVHKFKLVKFRRIESIVRDREQIILLGNAEDFRNVLRILYASFDSLVRFTPDMPAVISTLRVATTYDYPELREFAIEQLDAKKLPTLDYLPLALNFKVAHWEKRALDELVSRDKPITEAEANILGPKLIVATVNRREERLQSKQKVPQLLDPFTFDYPDILGPLHRREVKDSAQGEVITSGSARQCQPLAKRKKVTK